MNRKIDTMTRNPPVLPNSAMAIVGTTESVAAQGTAQLMAIANTRCPQLSTTRVPVVPAMVQPSPMKNGIMVLPCKPTLDMVWSNKKEIRARYPVSSIRLKPSVMPSTNDAIINAKYSTLTNTSQIREMSSG